MAWTYCEAHEVSEYSGFAVDTFREIWSTIVEDMIDDHLGYSYGSDTVYTDEEHDGDGSEILFIDHPPVQSVSSLSIGGTTVTTSEYEVYPGYIKLVQTYGTNIQDAIGESKNVFPRGQNNISITYTSGSGSTIPGNVRFCAMQMLTMIAIVSKRGGSDAVIPISRRTEQYGSSDARVSPDLSTKMNKIMNEMLGPGKGRFKFR